MGSRLKVEVLEPAPEITFRWLESMLAAPIAACKFESPPSVMLMPLCNQGRSAPNGQYCRADNGKIRLSTKARFWHPLDIVKTYLHEAAHAIVDAAEMKRDKPIKDHGAIFLLVLMTLHERIDASRKYRWVLKDVVNFYDCQDAESNSDWPEHRWRSFVVNFAFKHYHALAEMDINAEELGLHACQLWAHELLEADKWQSTSDLQRAERDIQGLKVRVAELEEETWIAPLRKLLVSLDRGLLVIGAGFLSVLAFTAGYGAGLVKLWG